MADDIRQHSAGQHVLLVKTSSLGDVIHAMPAITEAASHGVRITWVVEEAFADIARLHPHVHAVIEVAVRRWRSNLSTARTEFAAFRQRLRKDTYDLVLDSQGLLKSAAISLLAKGPVAGYSHTSAREPWSAFFYRARHRVAPHQHAIQRQRQLFAQALGYPLAAQMPDGLPIQVERGKQVLLLHGTTWATKHWPDRMWQGLAELVAAAGYEAVMTWGNSAEQVRAEQLAQQASVTVLPKQSLPQLAQHLAAAAAVVGVDTGLTHLSATMGTPTVGVYGPTSPALTGCLGRHTVSLSSQLQCAPCIADRCRAYRGAELLWREHPVDPPCFAELTPERVWQQAQQLMQQAAV